MPPSENKHEHSYQGDAAFALGVATLALVALYWWSTGESEYDLESFVVFIDDVRTRIVVCATGGYVLWLLLTPYRKSIADFSGRALENVLAPVLGDETPKWIPPALRNLSPIYWPNNEEGRSRLNRTLSQQMNTIDPILFEELVAELLRLEGLHTEAIGGRQQDGGIDVRAMNINQELIIVQCKRYVRDRVGIRLIRSLASTMKREGAKHGIFVNLRGFYPDVYPAASSMGIQLWSGTKLKEVIIKHRDVLPDRCRRYIAEPRPKCPHCNRRLSYVDRDPNILHASPHWACLTKDSGCGYVKAYFGEVAEELSHGF